MRLARHPPASPTPSAPPRPCARAGTRCCWRRCCRSSRSRPISSRRLGRRPHHQRQCRRAPSPAIRARDGLLALPVFAVGQRSAEAARAAGFADVTSADGDVRDLVRAARRAASPTHARRCFISPARIAPAISSAELAAHGIAAEMRGGLSRRSPRRFPPTLTDGAAKPATSTACCISPGAAPRAISPARAQAGIAEPALSRAALLPVGAGRRAAAAAGAAASRSRRARTRRR